MFPSVRVCVRVRICMCVLVLMCEHLQVVVSACVCTSVAYLHLYVP